MDGKDVLKMIGRAGLNYLKNGIKKVASKLVANPYFWAAVGIILIIMIITGMCIDVEAQGCYDNANGVVGDGSISLTSSQFDKATFKKALQAYYDSTKNSSFKTNFLDKADTLYDASVKSGVNPELVVVTALCEGGFTEVGGSYNYWGIGVYNGSSTGASYSSLEDGIAGYANTLAEYNYGGDYEAEIISRYEERKAAGCDPDGYGMPGTFSGMQSVYSDLGKHEYGSSGDGGYYYMDPARAGVTKIYSTHEEFVSKCYNVDGEHAEGTKCTNYERGQYTAWQVEKKIDAWNNIFGNYGSLTMAGNGGGTQLDIGGDYSNLIDARFYNAINKKTYLVVNQHKVGNLLGDSGWNGYCNRGAALIIGSAEESKKTLSQQIDKIVSYRSGNVFSNGKETDFFGNFLNMNIETVNDGYQKAVKDVLPKGGTVVFYVIQSNARTPNAPNVWASWRHYVTIIGYEVRDGKEWIFAAESSHKNSGWYPIDEFQALENKGGIQSKKWKIY